MLPQLDDPRTYNEEVYDQLISLIENSQGRLAPIIVACDDSELRQRIISRYEAEAQQVQIRPYRISLGQEPSMRAGLEALKQQDPYLQQGGKAVFTVTGAGLLLRVKLNLHEDQSQLDKFFGYLQWTREGLREFRYPIVLWVTQQILREISHRAPDFWSWRKAVLRFADESPYAVERLIGLSQSQPTRENSATEFLPPLEELQVEITELTARTPDAPGLAILYDQLGQIYAQRIERGKAENLEQEREGAINSFQQAINRYQAQGNRFAEANTLSQLANFFYQQCRYSEAIALYHQSLQLFEQIGNVQGKAATLHELAILKANQGAVEEAIALYHQSLQLTEKIGDVQTKAATLHQLAILKAKEGAVEEAIALHHQSLQLKEQIGNVQGKAATLAMLGQLLADEKGEIQTALAYLQESLAILQHLRSPDAATVASIIHRIQNLAP